MSQRFDLASFCALVSATPKECNSVRQDLVRGLKDYLETAYGYDPYGAETVLHLPTHMAQPYIFGFGVMRVLHDRRLSQETRTRVARAALDSARYGVDRGIPYGLFSALNLLAAADQLSVEDTRYALTLTSGEGAPFAGVARDETAHFLSWLLANGGMAPEERAFWVHSLLVRVGDSPGAADLVDCVLGESSLPMAVRTELALAWLSFRQPRIEVELPPPASDDRSLIVERHLPFWIAHAPSYPTLAMVRRAPVWLARLGHDPVELAETYLQYDRPFADQAQAAVVDIIAENHGSMSEDDLRRLIDLGTGIRSSSSLRRRFYTLGNEIFGRAYLERASEDSAGSVRQWATRLLL